MKAYLYDSIGTRTIVDVPAFPHEPRIVVYEGQEYAVDDPGFVFNDGVNSYLPYHAAIPYLVP